MSPDHFFFFTSESKNIPRDDGGCVNRLPCVKDVTNQALIRIVIAMD